MGSSRFFDIELIHARLLEFKQQDPNLEAFGAKAHGYELNPPLDQVRVETWESQNGVTLPDEYRDFLLHVGNGGAGRDYGLYFLESVFVNPEEAEYAGGPILDVSTAGCSYNYGIVANGPFAGTVWQCDHADIDNWDRLGWAPKMDDYLQYKWSFPSHLEYARQLQERAKSSPFCSFYDWYMDWITNFSPQKEIERSKQERATATQTQSQLTVDPFKAIRVYLEPWLKKKDS